MKKEARVSLRVRLSLVIEHRWVKRPIRAVNCSAAATLPDAAPHGIMNPVLRRFRSAPRF